MGTLRNAGDSTRVLPSLECLNAGPHRVPSCLPLPCSGYVVKARLHGETVAAKIFDLSKSQQLRVSRLGFNCSSIVLGRHEVQPMVVGPMQWYSGCGHRWARWCALGFRCLAGWL